MTERRPVFTSAAPAAAGPYSQAIVAAGLVYCSGQVALIPETGEMLEGDVVQQAEQVFKNLAAVLSEAGSSPSHVVKCQVYLESMEDFAVVNEVYARFFEGTVAPARVCIQAARLPKDAAVEIDCIALVA